MPYEPYDEFDDDSPEDAIFPDPTVDLGYSREEDDLIAPLMPSDTGDSFIGPPVPPSIKALAKSAAVADKSKMEPPPTPVDSGAKFDELMASAAEDPRRAELRDQRLPFKDALAIALGNTGKGRSGMAIQQMIEAREAKRKGDVQAFDAAREQKIKDYLAKKKMASMEEGSDPNSQVSQMYQQYAAKLFPQRDFTGMPADQIEPLIKSLQSTYTTDAKIDSNKIIKGLAHQQKIAAAKAKQRQRDFDQVSAAITKASGFQGRGIKAQFMQSNNRALLTKDGMRVIEQIRQGKFDPNRAINAELAAQLAGAMLAGGVPAAETIEHFMTNTAQSTFFGVLQYITGSPKPQMTKDMLDQMYHQLAGQYDYWREVRNNSLTGMGIALERVFENPEYGESERNRFGRGVASSMGEDFNLYGENYAPAGVLANPPGDSHGGGKKPPKIGDVQNKGGNSYKYVKDPATGKMGWLKLTNRPGGRAGSGKKDDSKGPLGDGWGSKQKLEEAKERRLNKRGFTSVRGMK